MRIKAEDSFGLSNLTDQKANKPRPISCPIKGCNNELEIHGKYSVCSAHGLELHNNTFVYYNGDDVEDKTKARLRNILPFAKGFFEKHILDNKLKAESHRLGNENSEDALTWNIFAGFLHYNKMHTIYNKITGENASTDKLRLFLWGIEINFDAPKVEFWQPLLRVRNELEKDIKCFHTEPDIMILGPKYLVAIEAKFTSGNTVAIDKETSTDGEKPKSREGLINRYIVNNTIWKQPVIGPEDIGEKVHSQLLRMLVFTSTMAQLEKKDWIVANLVSKTQWCQKKKHKAKEYDFNDPTSSIPATVRSNFKFISWEDNIYKEIIKEDSELTELSKYMREKTANLKTAFDLSA